MDTEKTPTAEAMAESEARNEAGGLFLLFVICVSVGTIAAGGAGFIGGGIFFALAIIADVLNDIRKVLQLHLDRISDAD